MLEGVNTIDATGTDVTNTAAETLRPSLLAVIVVPPGARAVTAPVLSTSAIAVLPTVHAIARPMSGAPDASRALAVSCTRSPVVSRSSTLEI